jgi:hypothetical protein
MDSVHHAVNRFHVISNRKIIWINLENNRTLEFCKNIPKLFWNYVLVPVILHLGPYLSFFITIRSFPYLILFILITILIY